MHAISTKPYLIFLTQYLSKFMIIYLSSPTSFCFALFFFLMSIVLVLSLFSSIFPGLRRMNVTLHWLSLDPVWVTQSQASEPSSIWEHIHYQVQEYHTEKFLEIQAASHPLYFTGCYKHLIYLNFYKSSFKCNIVSG